MDGGNVYGDEIDCPHHHYTYDAHTGGNRYPKRVFPRARAEQVKPIRAFPTRQRPTAPDSARPARARRRHDGRPGWGSSTC